MNVGAFDLFAQRHNRSFGLAVEINAAYANTAKGGFNDPEPRHGIAYGWLNDVSRGTTLEGKVVFILPYGLRLYTGLHLGNFPEQGADATLWTRVYQQDFQDHFVTSGYAVQNRTWGGGAGLAYALRWLSKSVHPYVFGEIRTETLRSTTSLEGVADRFFSIFGPESGPFAGSSRLDTGTGTGYGAGFGLEIVLGRFELLPEWRYVSVSAKILDRELEYTILNPDEGVRRSTTRGNMKIPEGQKIAFHRFEYRLGLRVRLF
jgi:hypothetical protein